MRLFSSLRSRIFVTSALLAVLTVGVAIYLVNVSVTREAEDSLKREHRGHRRLPRLLLRGRQPSRRSPPHFREVPQEPTSLDSLSRTPYGLRWR